MSTSKLLPRNLFKVATAKSILARGLEPWRTANTVEEQQLLEAKILNQFLDVQSKEINYLPTTIFDSPDLNYVNSVYGAFTNYNVSNRAKYSVLADLYLNKYNNSSLMLQDLINQVKRIKQKQSVLSLGTSKFRKYATGSSFLSLVGLNYDFCAGINAELDSIAGAVHLPITLRQQQSPTSVLIGAESNGAAGSSDLEVDASNQKLDNLLVPNNTSPFFYERLNKGPCQLTLIFQFNRPTIINQLITNLNLVDDGIAPELSKIIFTTVDNQHIGFKDLTNQSIKTVTRADEQIGVMFPPIEVVGVSLTLVQSSAGEITKANGKTVKQFAIAVNSVEFWQNQYATTGMINSEVVNLPTGLFAFEPVIHCYPSTQEFFDLAVDVSFDGGSTWKLVGNENKVDISLVQGRSFLWRLKIDRVDEAFTNYSSFLPIAFDSIKRKFIQKVVAVGVSPYSLALTSKPKGEEDIYAWQPRIVTRGDIKDGVRVGSISTVQTKFALPFDATTIDPYDLVVSIGQNEMVYVEPGNIPSGEEWTYADDFKSIVLGSGLTSGSLVYISLRPEELYLVDNSDGYLGVPLFAFDTDMERIQLKAIEAKPIRTTETLSKTQTIVHLKAKNLNEDSFKLTSATEVSWTAGINRVDITGETNQYWLDSINGILYLSNTIGDDNVSVSFEYYQDKKIDSSSFDIYYEGAKPIGLLIKKKALPVQTLSESIGNDVINSIDPLTGTHGQRTVYISGSTKTKQLGYKNIIQGSFEFTNTLLASGLQPEEVEFIDGKTEFLGLIKVNKELTNEQQANGSGNVSFYLAARSLWYREFGVSFSSSYFSDKVAVGSSLSLGQYYIQKDGLVVVNVGSGNTLPADIAYSYYYRAEDLDPENKISIDYRNGILYAYAELNSDARVSYSVCPVLAYYDVVKPLAFDYDKTVNQLQFSTVGMDTINNYVKVSWIEAPYDLSPSKVKENFTPVVSKIGFRFS